MSKGVLVTLEQGRSNPNLATLARIGDAFGVPVTLLVDLGGEPAVQVSSPDASRVLWRGPSGGTGTIIGATDPPWAAELWRWEVMPGESFGGDAHAPATREMVWVESGTLTLTVAGEPHAIGAGQCARSRPAARTGTRTRAISRRASPWWWSSRGPRNNNVAGLTCCPWLMSQSRAA